MSCVFPNGDCAKDISAFSANEKFARILLLWHHFMGLKNWDSDVVVFMDLHVPLCEQNSADSTPCHPVTCPGFVNIALS